MFLAQGGPRHVQFQNVCHFYSHFRNCVFGALLVLIGITSILSNPLLEGSPFNTDAATLFKTNKAKYNEMAQNSSNNQFLVPEFQSLYLKFSFWRFETLKKKFLKYERNRIIKIEDFCYPHDKLDEIFETIEKEDVTFVSTKIVKAYKKSKTSFSLIKAAENNVEKWAKEIMKCKSIEFFEDNVQFRICENLKHEELWKFYFKFLKENNTEKLLQMYSYYCRFFPDDNDILEEYEQAVKEFGPNFVPWKNPFHFEIFDDSETFNEILNSSQIIEIQPDTFTKIKSPVNNNAEANIFPFKSPLINYILENCPPEVLQKLHQTCKYFFRQIPTPICYKLEMENDTSKLDLAQYEKHTIKFKYSNFENPAFQNIHLSTILSVSELNDPFAFSKFHPRIFQCSAKYISISSQNLNESELKFLISSKRVLELELENTHIFDDNEELIMLEEILKLAPKIKRVRIDFVRCNPETFKTISEMSFENKIELFHLTNISNEIESTAFAKFIENNATSKSIITLKFAPEMGQNYISYFIFQVYEKLAPAERPTILTL